MSSLAVKYRPKTFEEVSSQVSVIKILNKQLETKQFVNTYLFSGASGTGKTTIARIFADKINDGVGEPIEIDAASHNSVNDIRLIVEEADKRSLDSTYKVYIIDEAHQITSAAWASLLKTIEEPPKYTVFIFCTTEYNKVPKTIQNRCQQFNFTKISDQSIIKRLQYICSCENITIAPDAIAQITKLAQGSMRQAITYLDKCKDFSDNITLDSVLQTLGNYSYDTFFKLTNALIDKDKATILSTIDDLYNVGSDLKLFIEQYIDFILDVCKYSIFRSYDVIKIPQSCDQQLKYILNLDCNVTEYYNKLLDKLLDIKVTIKGDSNLKTTIEIMLLNL